MAGPFDFGMSHRRVNGDEIQPHSVLGCGAILTLQTARFLNYIDVMNFMPARITKGLPRRKFTVAEVESFMRKGIIREHERFELIGGEIIPMSPKGNWHESLKQQLLEYFFDNRKQGGRVLRVIPETTFRLSRDTFIEPDVLIYPDSVDLRDISGTNVLLAVEIADSSLKYDLDRKPMLYAHFGIRELWVVDAKKRETTVHREPVDDVYRSVQLFTADQRIVPVLAPEMAVTLEQLR
jgi:Uma2 family endonuclease